MNPELARGVNYYPAHYEGGRMLLAPPSVIAMDFAKMRNELGADTIRLCLFPSSTGYPHIYSQASEAIISLLNKADDYWLGIHLVLFGGFTRWDDLVGCKVWISDLEEAIILAPPSLKFLDLYNELPLSTNPAALSWAKAMIPELRSRFSVPITISTNTPEDLAAASQLPIDFCKFHYYGPIAKAGDYIAQARSLVEGEDKEFVLGETGYSSEPTAQHNSPTRTRAWWEWWQRVYYSAIADRAMAAGCPSPPWPWICNDFALDAYGSNAPPVNSGQFSYGAYHIDGTAKHLALGIRNWFSAQRDLDFNGNLDRYDETMTPLGWWNTGNALYGYTPDAEPSISISNRSGLGESAWTVRLPHYINPGTKYLVKCDSVGEIPNSSLGVAWFAGDGTFIQKDTLALPGSFYWGTTTFRVKAPQNAAQAEIHAILNGPGSAKFRKFYFSVA